MTENTALPRPLVSTEWLAANLDADDLRIVDCSVVMRATDEGYTFAPGREEWQAGHVPGSAFVDIQNELAHSGSPLPLMLPEAGHFAGVMEGLGIGEGTRTVLYDRSNHAWAARVWWMLRVHGYDDVAVLDGGWNKWVAEDRPVSRQAPPRRRGRFPIAFRPELVASREHVVEALDRPDTLLINALSPAEFEGSTSRFPRAGRIPGSVNVYCQSLVDPETHCYLPPERLREAFGAAADAARAITYCGAGIAASSDALALAVIGRDDVAVYDGSLSEWTADPELPLESD